jgi:proteasome lid subunit RPN8/RPN11
VVRIDEATLAELRTHALETYPDECCGAVVTDADGRREVIRMRNVQDEMHAQDPDRFPRPARTAYYPDSADLKAALDRAESPGHVLTAFYHSHPDHDAYFSEEDVAQATPFGEPSYPRAAQIVISVYGTEVRAVKAFSWSEPDETFVAIEIDGD